MKVLETDTRIWVHPPRSSRCGRTRPLVPFLPLYMRRTYHICMHSADPVPGTSCLEALANASGDESTVSPLDGFKKVGSKSLLAVPSPRHSYVTVVYRALLDLCETETFPYTPPTSTNDLLDRRHVSYFDFPKHVRKVIYDDLIPNMEHLKVYRERRGEEREGRRQSASKG
jgi:hypothetical protein